MKENIIQNVNELIDINLRSFIESGNGVFIHSNFKGIDGKSLRGYKRLGEIMKNEGLLTTENNRFFELEPKAMIVYNAGGWIKWKEIESKKETDNHRLQKENAELTNKNLKLQNRKLRRDFIVGILGILLGFILANWKDILIMLQIIDKTSFQ